MPSRDSNLITGSNPVEALIFFELLLSNCLSWKIYCDDHSLPLSTTAVQIRTISYILHISHSYDLILLHTGLKSYPLFT